MSNETTTFRRTRELVRPCCPPAAVTTLSLREAERRAARFKALADPTRLRMLDLLANAGDELCVCHIQERFPLSQPTISHHLKVLREAGLIRCVKRGLWVYCALAPAGLDAVRAALAELRPEP